MPANGASKKAEADTAKAAAGGKPKQGAPAADAKKPAGKGAKK
jgi:hypothetical protein